MITYKIVSKELFMGDYTKVVVELESEEVCTVEGRPVPTLDRSSDYHAYLHEHKITHSHNKQSGKATILIENPFTDEKLAEELVPITKAMEEEAADVNNFNPETFEVQEQATTSEGHERLTYELESAPTEVVKTLTDNFPDVDLSDIRLICTPVWHSLLEKTIITVLLWKTKLPDNIFYDPEVPVAYRKFCIEDKKYFDKCYVQTNERHPLVPEGCEVRFKSFNTNVQEGLDIPEFVDYYFYGDPDYVEEVLELPYKRGRVSTQYGITIHNGQIVRKKQYCYDEATPLADWI